MYGIIEQIQVCEITQKSIQNALYELLENEDWGGDLSMFDFTVTKKGEKMETKYSVTPSPAKPISSEITEEYKKKGINLKALFEGKDPFKKDENSIGDDFDKAQENGEINPNDLPF